MTGLFRKFELKPDGLLMLSLLIFFTDFSVLTAIVVNVMIHELGHLYFLRRYNVYIRRMYVGFTGLCIQCNLEGLPRRAYFFSAAAGPMFGLISAAISSFVGNVIGNEFLLLFSGTGLVLSLFNLLPVKPLDGWRMLLAITPKTAHIFGDVCAIMVFCIGIYVMTAGYGTALACMGIFFLMQGRVNPFFAK